MRFDAENLIVGDGEIIKEGSVVIDGSRIVYAGESEHAPKANEVQVVNTLMPGLWECHGHFIGIEKLDFNQEFFTHPFHQAMRTVGDTNTALLAGITSVREVGGYGVFLKRAIEEGTATGPRIYGSGGMLSITGGHGDLHSLPFGIWEYLKETSDHWMFNTVDGIAECLKGVRKQLRLGAEIIKFHSSGGVLSELDDPINQQFSFEEARAIVEEATRAQVAVAAHCHGAPGIRNALKAGVTSIEHGTFLDEELAELMIEMDAVLVPTRFIIEESLKLREMLPDYAREKMDLTAGRHWEALQMAIRKGVTIAMGTDIAGSRIAPINRWGDNAKELEYYVKAGMSEMEAIVCATGNGPKTLGPRAPRSGQLKEGYDADLLLLNKNPLEDITLLQNRENFINIVKAGKRVF